MAIKIDSADRMFSQAIRLNRNYQCESCGTRDGKMECAHIYGRAHKSVRWDTMNALCLCYRCHLYFTGNPVDFTQWLNSYFGEGHMQILNEKRNRIQKTTAAYRKEVAAHYRAEVKRLEAGERGLRSFQ